ncbi:S8 family serine peptidase [Pedobacter panaciterrae]|uniref:S8 family serine peptidase n=1 Tax=Pedobacter panaciterrae TaxID=363849 RepID=UPI002592C6FA|nr:S8 family serine peptidase [uncultured Pedobacter sp.]
MASSKIIAYFMHDREDTLISKTISIDRKTESFYIGEATSKQIEYLRDARIIVQLLHDMPSKEPDDMDFDGFSTNVNNLRKTSSVKLQLSDHEALLAEEENAGFPSFYKFATLGPLLDEDKSQLDVAGIDLVEFIPPSTYVVRINSEDLYKTLSLFDFTRDISYYSSNDTAVKSSQKSQEAMPTKIQGHDIATFDVLLYRTEDLSLLLSWFKENNILVAGASGVKARIYLIYDSPLIRAVSANPLVRYMNEYIKPKLHNDRATQIIGVDTYAKNVSSPSMSFQGEGEIIGIADTGIDISHPDLVSCIIGTIAYGRVGNVTDPSGHGTHVAGSIAGDGSASSGSIKGIAPKAKIYFQSLLNSSDGLSFPLQLGDLFNDAYKHGARIHNNSWGSSTESRYTVSSIEVDDFVYSKKDMLLVFSAGNDGSAAKYINVPKGQVDFLSIGSPASAKNVLTVGASRNSRKTAGFSTLTYNAAWPNSFPYPPYDKQTVSGDPDCLAGFSSRGPCDDDRIKPDVVAPGTDIASTKSMLAPPSNFWGPYPGNSQYALMGGTSMSAPIVAGFAALVREYFMKVHQVIPSAALLKATIINGSKKLNGYDALLKFTALPNFNQGFGLINAGSTIPTPSNNFFFYFVDNYKDPATQFLKTGQAFRLKFKVNSPGNWLRVCLAYTDLPARALQNNLNLIMDCTSQKWLGNENAASLLKQLDTKNNVETITVEDTATGTYTIQIVASNLIKGPQDFALVITSSDHTIDTPFKY